MPVPQKNSPQGSDKGAITPTQQNGVFRPCISVDASKKIPNSGVLGRSQYVEANSGMYSTTRIRPYLKILKYI